LMPLGCFANHAIQPIRWCCRRRKSERRGQIHRVSTNSTPTQRFRGIPVHKDKLPVFIYVRCNLGASWYGRGQAGGQDCNGDAVPDCLYAMHHVQLSGLGEGRTLHFRTKTRQKQMQTQIGQRLESFSGYGFWRLRSVATDQ
jgi:hypothetical protein